MWCGREGAVFSLDSAAGAAGTAWQAREHNVDGLSTGHDGL